MGKNREIGKNNQLLWHISEDLKNFKKLTLGHHLLMGRKTFESIGKALPGRSTIILTRDETYQKDGCYIAHSIDQALKMAKDNGETELFICGGAEIYQQVLGLTDTIYLSKVDFEGPADTYFPKLTIEDWQIIKEELVTSSKAPGYTFQILKAKGLV